MTKVTIVDIVPWEFLIIQSLESSSEKAYRKVSYIRRLQMSRGGSSIQESLIHTETTDVQRRQQRANGR